MKRGFELKIKLIVLTICLTFVLTSCTTTNVKTTIYETILDFFTEFNEDDSIDESIAIYYDVTYEIAAEEIMQYLINEDVDEIVDLFSAYAKENYDLSEEVNAAIEFIDGEIISYNDPDARNSSGSYSNHTYTLYNYKCEISDIITDTGKTYLIIVFTCVINADNEDCVGITKINVIDSDEFTYENDYPDEAKFVIGEK